MGERTSIEWTWGPQQTPGSTWNVVRGCDLEDDGCANCYAMGQAHRSSGPGGAYVGLTRLRPSGLGPVWTGEVRFVLDELATPLSWRRPRWVFVNSMSDLFHPAVAEEHIAAILGVMALCPEHVFIVLTKRAWRARQVLARLTRGACLEATARVIGVNEREALRGDALWPLPNLWLGASVSGSPRPSTARKELLATPATLRLLSVEPLIGPFNVEPWAPALDWVLVGGESGGKARPMQLDWVRTVARACQRASTPVFVKQAGRRPMGNVLVPASRLVLGNKKGSDLDEWPEEMADLKVREWPRAATARAA